MTSFNLFYFAFLLCSNYHNCSNVIVLFNAHRQMRSFSCERTSICKNEASIPDDISIEVHFGTVGTPPEGVRLLLFQPHRAPPSHPSTRVFLCPRKHITSAISPLPCQLFVVAACSCFCTLRLVSNELKKLQ